MAASMLGKRTRSSASADALLPAKRTRRSGQAVVVNATKQEATNNNSIEALVCALDDQENTPPSSIQEDSAPNTPSRRRALQALPKSSTSKISWNPITPQTPRHYDVFARSSSTPRHRVMSAGKLSSRLTPQTPLTPTSCQTIYHRGRQLFSRSSDAGQLIGRDEERARLLEFLGRWSRPHPGGCLYVSGPPGTGKSAMVSKVAEDVAKDSSSIHKAYVNCMSVKSTKDLHGAMLDQLCNQSGESPTGDDAAGVLEKLFMPKKKSGDVYLVVLDEVDHILTVDQEILYQLFEWSLQKTSRLILVGIANALDLTDRFLPRLKSRNLKPELLPFMPYTAPQIKNIITTRLKSLLSQDSANHDYLPLFHPAAIELCARKVASQTGDLRKAFEVCRRSLDLVEQETRLKHEIEIKEKHLQMTPSRKVLGENANLASAGGGVGSGPAGRSLSADLVKSLQSLTSDNAPRVSIGHLNKVTAAAFSHGTSQRLKTLNLQQKAALCALIALENRSRAAKDRTGPVTPSKTSQVTAPTVKVLFDTYCVLCTRDAVLHPLSSSEFREVVSSLETLSLITPVDGKTGSFAVAAQTPSRRGRKPGFAKANGSADEMRVASCVGEREIATAMDGLGADILQSILSGQALD